MTKRCDPRSAPPEPVAFPVVGLGSGIGAAPEPGTLQGASAAAEPVQTGPSSYRGAQRVSEMSKFESKRRC